MGETFGRTDRFGCRPEASTEPRRQPPTEELWVLAALLLSFAVIFVAEMGDKTHLPGMLAPRWQVQQ